MCSSVVKFFLLICIFKIGAILVKCDQVELATKQKRALIFPTNGGMGVIIAIALPIDIAKRNVFLSYTFEANYGLPTQSTHFTQGILNRLDLVQPTSKKLEKRNIDQQYNLITRKNIYRIIENKLNLEGYNGRACFLDAICETVQFPLNKHNGVLGDIIHILLTPSLTSWENINAEYYNAENIGKEKKCEKYKVFCKINLLNFITRMY